MISEKNENKRYCAKYIKKLRTTLCIQTKINNVLYKISGSMYYKTNNWL